MGNLKYVLEQSKLYSVELRTNSQKKTLSVYFWEGGHLADIDLRSIPRDIPVVKGELSLISQLQFAVGTGPQIISCGGCNAYVLMALDRQTCMHYPF